MDPERRHPVRLRLPKPRKGGVAGSARRIWTAPTTWLGHAIARLAGCGMPVPVGGQAGRAWLYRLPEGRLPRFGGVALGHAIIIGHGQLERLGPWMLVHELAHTRQHDWLGPLYLPAHILCQLASAARYAVGPKRGTTPWHAYNPLERSWIAVPIEAVLAPPTGAQADEVLRRFGVTGEA